MNTKIVIGALAVLVIVFGVFTFKKQIVVHTPLGSNPAPIVNVPAPIVNVESPTVNVAAPNVTVKAPEQKQVAPVYGALSSPDIPYEYLSVNGVRQYFAKASFNTGTSSLCAMKFPAATSTLKRFMFNQTNGTSTALTFTLATSTSPSASTTFLYRFSLAASQEGSFEYMASTSANGMARATGSSTAPVYATLSVAGSGSASGHGITGACLAVFDEFPY